MGGGTAEGLLAVYFGMMGWPVPDEGNKRMELVERIHDVKIEIFQSMVLERRIPLRAGAAEFIRELAEDGAKVRPRRKPNSDGSAGGGLVLTKQSWRVAASALLFVTNISCDNNCSKVALLPATASHPNEGVVFAALDCISESCGADIAKTIAVVGGFPGGSTSGKSGGTALPRGKAHALEQRS